MDDYRFSIAATKPGGDVIDGDFVVATNEVGSGNQVFELAPNLILTVTPGVQLNTAVSPNLRLAVIGDIYDPHEPMLECPDIVERLSGQPCIADMLKGLHVLGGCYVVVASWDTEAAVFTDATTLRKVYFRENDREDASVVLSSSIDDLARALSLSPIDELVVNSAEYEVVGSAPYLPGDLTPFPDIKHLMPCHYLDLIGRKQVRFNPQQAKDSTYRQIVETFSNILHGSAAATQRIHGNCMIAMTAGIDSRTSLAAFSTLEAPSRFGAFTFNYPYLDDNHSDILVARAVCAKVGVTHDVIPVESSQDAETIYSKRFDGTIINSNIADLYRVYYRLPAWACTPKFMLKHEGMLINPHTTATMKTWFSQRGDLAGLDWLDCFYWEHRLSRWAATGFSGPNLRVPKANIFNTAELYHLAMQVPYNTRRSTQFSKDLIDALHPGLSSIPINPAHGISKRMASRIKNSPIEAPFQYVRTLIK